MTKSTEFERGLLKAINTVGPNAFVGIFVAVVLIVYMLVFRVVWHHWPF